jgi:hypothetical protein
MLSAVLLAAVCATAPAYAGTQICSPGSGNFVKGGPAGYWHSSGVGVYGTGLWTYSNGNAVSNWANWYFDLSQTGGSGSYTVEAFIPRVAATTRYATYRIHTTSGDQWPTINQAASFDRWVNLGTYNMAQGDAWVNLTDSTPETYLSTQVGFDCVRVTFIPPPVVPVVPAQLALVSGPTLSAGPYYAGNDVTASFAIKNVGGQTGTWDQIALAMRGPGEVNRDFAPAAAATLAPGETRWFSVKGSPNVAGSHYGWVAVRSGSTWSVLGSTRAFQFTSLAKTRPVVSVPRIKGTTKRGRTITIYGTLSPQHAAGRPSVVIRTAYVKGGGWVTKDVAVPVVDSAAGSSYSYKFKLPKKKRTWAFKAYAPADTEHLASTDSVKLLRSSRLIRVK